MENMFSRILTKLGSGAQIQVHADNVYNDLRSNFQLVQVRNRANFGF